MAVNRSGAAAVSADSLRQAGLLRPSPVTTRESKVESKRATSNHTSSTNSSTTVLSTCLCLCHLYVHAVSRICACAPPRVHTSYQRLPPACCVSPCSPRAYLVAVAFQATRVGVFLGVRVEAQTVTLMTGLPSRLAVLFPCCVRVHRYWGTYCKRCNFGRSSCGLTATHTTTPQPRSVRPAAGGREWDGLETWRHLDTHIKALTCSNSNSLNRWQPGWVCGLAAARCILSQIKLKIKRTFFLCLPVAVLCLLQLPVAVLVLIHPCCSRARHWWHR